MVREAPGLPDDWRERAAKLGADVPACVDSVACIGRGIGTELEPVENDLAGTPVLLINPRVQLSTSAVFAAWDGEDRGALPAGAVSEIAGHGRNDLEPAAISLCPEVAEVLAALRQTDATLVRMSGSGATCFALYRSTDAMRGAASELASRHPGWWQMQGNLR
jgi:4-diphosphocytidyl-2-C-methyl-D-erythritol kinase